MKRVNKAFFCVTIFAVIVFSQAFAQKQSIPELILKGFNEAHQGFPSFINDTLPYDGWNYKIKPFRVNQFEGVKQIEISFEKNFHSRLVSDAAVKLNQMKITGETILLGIGKTWDDYKDTLTSYYNNIVSFYKKAFGKQLNYTPVIQIRDPKEANSLPRYSIYFYEKSITIPDTLTYKYDIERQLDVVSWFNIELKENVLIESQYNIVYNICGGQKQ